MNEPRSGRLSGIIQRVEDTLAPIGIASGQANPG